MLVASLFGYAWVLRDQVLLAAAAVPALGVVYVLGIIWDRIADSLFERIWVDDLRSKYFRNQGDYHRARRIIITNSAPLFELLEYGRSRMRICRGWTLNAIAIALCFNLLIWLRHPRDDGSWAVALFGTLTCAAISAGSWFAWSSLAKTEYRKITEQSAFLEGTAKKTA